MCEPTTKEKNKTLRENNPLDLEYNYFLKKEERDGGRRDETKSGGEEKVFLSEFSDRRRRTCLVKKREREREREFTRFSAAEKKSPLVSGRD